MNDTSALDHSIDSGLKSMETKSSKSSVTVKSVVDNQQIFQILN